MLRQQSELSRRGTQPRPGVQYEAGSGAQDQSPSQKGLGGGEKKATCEGWVGEEKNATGEELGGGEGHWGNGS